MMTVANLAGLTSWAGRNVWNESPDVPVLLRLAVMSCKTRTFEADAPMPGIARVKPRLPNTGRNACRRGWGNFAVAASVKAITLRRAAVGVMLQPTT